MVMGYSGGWHARMIPVCVLGVSSGSTQQLIARVLPERPEW